jgi:hypothetical protein
MKNKLSEFRLPPDGRTYITAIVDRCKELINCGVWGDLDILRFEAWLNKFTASKNGILRLACLTI